MELALFLKINLHFNSFYCLFCLHNKTLRFNNLKSRTAMNAKFPLFVTFVEAMKYLLLYKLHDCTFNSPFHYYS